MNEAAGIQPPRATRHIAFLAGVACVLCLAALLVPFANLPMLALLAGSSASATIAGFAWSRRRRAERLARSDRSPSRGRIVERREAGRVVLELPADGIEPWGFDAWVLAVTTLGVVLLGQSARPVVYVFLAFLIAAVGVRLFAMRNDRIRLELRKDGYLVDAVSANRPIHRFGPGPILPELGTDALTLWSSAGRLGVLRNELTGRERAWLADRLASLAERASIPGDSGQELDQQDPRDDGKREQEKHTE